MNANTFHREFDQYTAYLRTFALKLTSDPVQAEDLYQDTAFLAFKNREKFKPNTNLKAWLGTIMRNTFINDFRRKKRKGEILDSSKNNFLMNSGKQIIRNEGEGQMTMKELEELIADLDEKFRKPFLMAYEGYKYEEICQHTNAALGTVKSRIFLARKTLQSRILEIYGEQRPNFQAA